jgi:hypothetical protein
MRNRAVELHLSPAYPLVPLTCEPLAAESAMARFRVVGRYASDAKFTSAANGSILHDHLAFSDRATMRDFGQEINRSLFSRNIRSEAGTANIAIDSFVFDEAVLAQILSFHQENAENMGLPSDFAYAQVGYPLKHCCLFLQLTVRVH